MQETRRLILEILREYDGATVETLMNELSTRRGEQITAVTIRHHLGILQSDELITIRELKHTAKPGRPQHVYTLTEKALSIFPNNFPRLAANLLMQIEQRVPEHANVILDCVAESMASEVSISGQTLIDRLHSVSDYLNDCGYVAYFEATELGYLLHTRNCPYHSLSTTYPVLCQMDIRLISRMLGVVPRMVSHIASGENTCTYFVPESP